MCDPLCQSTVVDASNRHPSPGIHFRRATAPPAGRVVLEREAPVKFSRRAAAKPVGAAASRRSPALAAGALAVGLMTLGTAAAVQAAPSQPSPSGTEALQAQAVKSADAFIAGRPGVLHPSAEPGQPMRFRGASLRRARVAVRLTRDLEVNTAGIALALDLLDEIAELRTRLTRAGAR